MFLKLFCSHSKAFSDYSGYLHLFFTVSVAVHSSEVLFQVKTPIGCKVLVLFIYSRNVSLSYIVAYVPALEGTSSHSAFYVYGVGKLYHTSVCLSSV